MGAPDSQSPEAMRIDQPSPVERGQERISTSRPARLNTPMPAGSSRRAISSPQPDRPRARMTDGSSIPAPSSAMARNAVPSRSEEHTSELQSLMRISYAVFCLQKKKSKQQHTTTQHTSNA